MISSFFYLPPDMENPASSERHIQCDCFALLCVHVSASLNNCVLLEGPDGILWKPICTHSQCCDWKHVIYVHLFFSSTPLLSTFTTFQSYFISGCLVFLPPVEKCMSSMQMGTQMVKLRGGSRGLVRFFYLDEHKSCIRWRPSRKNEKAKSECRFPWHSHKRMLNLSCSCGSVCSYSSWSLIQYM